MKVNNKKIYISIVIIIISGILISILANINFQYKSQKPLYYVENEKYAIFSDKNVFSKINNEINLYNVAWLTEIYSILNIDFPNKNKEIIVEYLNSNVDNDYIEKSDLDKVLLLVKVNSRFNKENFNKEVYKERLMKNFDPNSNLFYLESVDDSIDVKLNATSIALQIYEELNEIPNDIKESLIIQYSKLLNDNTMFNFDTNDYYNNLIVRGLSILYSASILNSLSSNEINQDIKTKENWYVFWNEWLNSFIDDKGELDVLAVNAINNMKKISELSTLEFKVNNNMEKILLSDSRIFNNDLNILFQYELQYEYQVINIFNIINIDIPKELKNKYFNNLDFWFYSEVENSDIYNIYYGINISKYENFKFNKSKVKEYLAKLINNTKEFDIYSLYYIYNICELLNLDTDQYYDLIYALSNNIIEGYLNGDENIKKSTYSNLYYSITLLEKIDDGNDILKKVTSTIDFGAELDIAETIFEKYYILKIDKSIDKNIIKKLIEEEFLQLNNSENQNIYNLYFLTSIIYENDIAISSDQKNKLLNVLNLFKSKNNEYFITKANNTIADYKDNFSLESYYYGIESNNMISKITTYD